MVEHDPNRKGNIAELAFATEATRLGLEVYKPLTEHGRCDFVLGIRNHLIKVQCKWAARKDEVICVRLKASSHSPTRGYVTSTYQAGEVDALGVYCGDLDRCYLIPIERVAGQQMVTLRLGAARNNQRAALNWASDYELPGAVAQLAERFAGSEEARGSNPLSSTPEAAVEAPAVEEVGAHQFRNHFGYYLERAAAGTEVLVSRRGKPHARLCPATD
jgi:prevent-host-death family protein